MKSKEALPRVALSAVVPPAMAGIWRDVFAGRHSEYWLSGGRGSGKSTFAAAAVIAALLRDSECSAVIYRKVQATLRESVFSQVLWVIDRLGLSALFESRLSPLELIYRPTGQRILFRGADDPAKSKSLKARRGYFGMLWFEELSEFDGMDDVRTVQASVLRGGPRAVTLCTFNPPQSARHWVNLEALKPMPGRMTHHSDYRDMPREWLGEAFLAQAEALRQQNEPAWRHMFLGLPSEGGGRVFANLRLESAEGVNAPRFYGLDFGFAGDPDALVECAWERKGGRLWLLRERVRRGQSLDELAEGAKDFAGEGIVTCDSADPRMIAELRRRGVLAVAAKKGPGSVMHGVRFLQSLREVVIDPVHCPEAAREFSVCEYLRSGDEWLPELPDRDNHTIDATRYALERVITGREAHYL
ncbi:MAG: PBSX family phage terminase large subunit [Eubacteriales bacterium]|nr:PBSX family phage terminase large subunit [Eubacteriales bacterium]